MNQGLAEGVVVDTNDPQQMGRFKAWIPGVDGEMYEIEDLPWVLYLTPTAGQTLDYPAGPNATKTLGYASYGWWSIPKIGACVVIGFLYGDPNRRVYVGSYFREHGNRSLPAGRNRADVGPHPCSDTFDPMEPQTALLNTQFRGNLSAPEARTRGAYERQVAQDKTDKDGSEGYFTNLVTPKDRAGVEQYDPQTTAFTSPGRHSLIFQDHPSVGRTRLKSAAGHQIILDDANERIYVSTAGGRAWVELDQDGRIHVYSGGGISVSTAGDFSVAAAGSINMSAGGDVGISAGGSLMLAGCASANLSGAGVNLESSGSFNILAAGSLLQTGSAIHLNGPSAGGANCPDSPEVVPTHEPWVRPQSAMARNPNWKA